MPCQVPANTTKNSGYCAATFADIANAEGSGKEFVEKHVVG